MDQIRIENLEIYGFHGVFPEETKDGQAADLSREKISNTLRRRK